MRKITSTLQLYVSVLLHVIGPVVSQVSGVNSSLLTETPNDCKREVFENCNKNTVSFFE